MRSNWFSAVALLGAALGAARAGDADRIALVIGVKDYKVLPELPYCNKDAHAIAAILGEYDFTKVIELTSDAKSADLLPTKENILTRLKDLLSDAPAGGTVIVYFAGHGFVGGDGANYLAPQDARKIGTSLDGDSLMDVQTIFELFQQCPAKKRGLLIDACRDVRDIIGQGRKPKVPANLGILRSCLEGRESVSSKKHERGLFTKVVHDCLSGIGKDFQPGEMVNWTRLAKIVVRDVPVVADAEGATQTAEVQGQPTEDFDFVGPLKPKAGIEGQTVAEAHEEAKSAQQRWAKYERMPAEHEFEIDRVKFKVRLIPPGSVHLGSPSDEPLRDSNEELPRIYTQARFYYLAETEVTQAQYELIVGSLPENLAFKDENKPVTNLKAAEADAFCDLLRKQLPKDDKRWDRARCRLPTESEWEYACRAFTRTPFWFGDKVNTQRFRCNLSQTYPDQKPGPARPKEPSAVREFDANPFGLHDMHGNVAEWCLMDSSKDRTHKEYVLRGGGYNAPAEDCRSAAREDRIKATAERSSIGFRFLIEIPRKRP